MPSPIGHTLMGCCLYADRSPLRRRSWWTLSLFMFFANAPDLDFIPGILFGHPTLFHRTMTHSVIFPFIIAGLLYGVMKMLKRAEAGRFARVAFFGLLSHIALDYFCTPGPGSGLALLWPFLDEKFVAAHSIFPPLSFSPILSWHNVLTAIAEATILSVFLLIAAVRRTLAKRGAIADRRQAPASRAYAMAEVSE